MSLRLETSVHLLAIVSLFGWSALKRSTAADPSNLTMSFLSSNAGVIKFNKAGLPLLAIANTAAQPEQATSYPNRLWTKLRQF